MSSPRTLLLALVILSGAAESAAQSTEPLLEFHVPPALSVADLQRAELLLACSDAQVAILEALHGEYTDRWAQLHDENLPALRSLALDGARLFTGQWGNEAVAAFKSMEVARIELNRRSAELDRELWTQIESLLAEPQVVHLHRLKQMRHRDRCRLTNRDLWVARIDLCALMESLKITPAPGSDLDAIMAEYDSAVTPPFIDVDEYLQESEVETLQLAVDTLFKPAPATNHPAGDGRREAYQAGLRRIMSPAVRMQRRIVIINGIFLPRILARLPADRARELDLAFKSAAYPLFYPDATDPIILYETILEAELPDEVQALLQGLWQIYRVEYDSVCERMQRLQEQQWESLAFTRSSANLPEFRRTLLALQRDRFEMNLSIATRLDTALPEDIKPRIAPLVQTYQREAARYRPPSE